MITVLETIEEFEQAIQSGVVIIDFYAEWCGPCKTMAKILDKWTLNVPIYKVDIDKLPTLKTMFYVTKIPTLVFFKDGKEVDRCNLIPLGKIEERTQTLLK